VTAEVGQVADGAPASPSAASRSGTLRRSALANVAGRGGSAVLWLVVTPLALSRLGPERFGVWSLFFVLGGYMASLDLGMSNGVSRYVALSLARGDRHELLSVFRRSVAVSVGLGVLWFAGCLLFRGQLIRAFHVPAAIAPEVDRSLVVFAVSLFAFSITQVINATLTGFQRLDLSNLCFLSGLTLHTTVLAIVLTHGFGLIGAACAALSGHLLSATLATVFLRRQLRQVDDRGRSTPVSWRELLQFGGAVQASGAGAIGQAQAGKVLLGMLGSLGLVTRFELGFRVANAVWSLPVLVQGAVIPASAHASAEAGVARVREVYDWACRWMFALAGFVLAGLWLLAAPALVMWLGPGHADSVGVTRWLAIVFAFATVSGPATAVARGGGWPLLETIHFLGALVINIAIGWLLIPRLGLYGALIAMGVSYGIACVWIVTMVHRRLGVSTPAWLFRVVLPRWLVPAAVEAVLGLLWHVPEPASRMQALRVFAVQGTAFLALSVACTWPLGDARVVLARLRARLGRA